MTELELSLSTEEIDGIVSFLGYGRPSAPIWFIGIEEGLGKMDSQDAIGNFSIRAKFERTMDLHTALNRLREKGQVIKMAEKAPYTPVWQWMAKIMAANDGGAVWSDCASARKQIRSDAEKYIRCHLGRSNGDTFLTELSPIPSGRTKDTTWLEWFRGRDPKLDDKIKRREAELKRILKENPQSAVICYGNGRDKAQWFAELLEIKWQPHCPGVCRSHDSKRLLLPFFGNGRMSYAVLESLLRSGLLPKIATRI